MKTYAEDKAVIVQWFTTRRARQYFLELGWQKRDDGRLYPPRGNHSMSEQDAICQYEMARRGESAPF